MRLIDADALEKQLDTDGCGYYGAEYYAYLAGVEHVKNLLEDADEIDDPIYEIYKKLDALYKRLNCDYERTVHVLHEEIAKDHSQERYHEGYNNALSKAMVEIALILEEMDDEP